MEWSKENISAFNSNMKVYKDRLFAIDFDNVIRCFSTKDGKELWFFKSENSFIKSQKKLSLVLKGELVYFINNAFTLKNSDLVFANDSIYFSNNKNEIFSINAKTGIVNWKQTVNSSLRPIIIENLIFSVSEEGYMFVIENQTGNIIRINNVLKNFENKKKKIKVTGFLIAKNKIYLSLNNGIMVKIDNENGKQEKIHKFTNSYISKPYYFNNNMYVIVKNLIIRIK